MVMKQYEKPCARGFTLLELLVVIAIIGILATLLIPVVSNPLEKGRRAGCRSNLKQIGTAMINFAADHNGWFPLSTNTVWSGKRWYSSPYTGSAGKEYLPNQFLPPRSGLTGIARTMHASGHLTSLNVWVCPSDRAEGPNNSIAVAPDNDIATFNSYGNASYMYIAGMNDKIYIASIARAAVLLDEASVRENGSATPGKMPSITKIDNHGADLRNVLYYGGNVVTLEGPEVANSAIFPEDADAWAEYRYVNSVD